MTDDLFPVPQSEPVSSENRPVTVKKNGITVNSVQADVVQLDDSNANLIHAGTINMHDSNVRQVNGQSVSITQGQTGVVNASNLDANNCGVGICSATDASVNGNVAVMIGQNVTLNNHRTGLVISNVVHGGPIRTIFFLTGKSEAPVETIVDQRSVALFGLASGIAIGLVFSLFRLLKR